MATALTICIPVFNAAAFVRDTIESVQAQTYPHLRIAISVDRSDDASVDICREYLADHRVILVEQTERLGWVKNVNALLSRVETDDFAIVPHDDILSPEYVATLVDHLDRTPGAVAVYPDIEYFGLRAARHTGPSLVGDTLSRLITFLASRFDAVEFRSVVRRSRADGIILLRDNPYDGFAADTLWVLDLACRGELHCVPSPLYQKRVSARSVVAEWKAWPRDRLIAAWVDHCVNCLRMVLPHATSAEEHVLLVYATVGRLLGAMTPLWLHSEISPRSEEERLARVSSLVARLVAPDTTPVEIAPLLRHPLLPALTRPWLDESRETPPVTPPRDGQISPTLRKAAREVVRHLRLLLR